jgi:RNA-directed DNA polymerase
VLVVSWMGDYQPTGAAEPDAVGSQGSAFPYKSSNRLITCDHVLRWEGDVNGSNVMTDYNSADVHGATIEVIQPGTGARWPIRVVHRDMEKDLAILEFVGAPPALRHFIGLDAPIRRNENGVLIGYPNWNAGRVANQIDAVVVNRFARRALQRLEISTMIRQGNSGGPFVDELFRVAGVAQEGATQDSGNDECLCVDELDKWIASVESGVPTLTAP